MFVSSANTSPYVELSGHSYIQSSAGYVSVIEYSGKGWVSGRKNSFKATISKNSDLKSPIYSVEGIWTDACTVRKGKSKSSEPLWDATKNPPQHVSIKPITEQGELESRKLWEPVAKALNAKDYETASREKQKLENAQRELRKDEKETGTTWNQNYFQWVSPDPLIQALVNYPIALWFLTSQSVKLPSAASSHIEEMGSWNYRQ